MWRKGVDGSLDCLRATFMIPCGLGGRDEKTFNVIDGRAADRRG